MSARMNENISYPHSMMGDESEAMKARTSGEFKWGSNTITAEGHEDPDNRAESIMSPGI